MDHLHIFNNLKKYKIKMGKIIESKRGIKQLNLNILRHLKLKLVTKLDFLLKNQNIIIIYMIKKYSIRIKLIK